jgi:hypothetical protein
LVMAYPTGVEERELETHQLTRVMYADSESMRTG